MRYSFHVHGRVQGVGFRAFTQRAGRDAGVRGWVQNEADGTVSGQACGSSEALERFTSAISQGPGWSNVTDVKTEAVDASAPLNADFEIR